jgi:hypothetical protein
MSIWIRVFLVFKIIRQSVERLRIGYYKCTNVIITLLGSSKESPLGFGGTDLTIFTLWEGIHVVKPVGISTLRSAIINFLTLKLMGIILRPLE